MNILQEPGFFKLFFEMFPSPVAITDNKAVVLAVNAAGRKFFCHTAKPHLQLAGPFFRCVHADEPGGCGKTKYCSECIVRKSIVLAAAGTTVSRDKGGFLMWQNGLPVRLDILVSAVRIKYAGRELVVIVLEEISHITRLQGLLPICSSCHSIRDEHNQWIRLEAYIERHTEANFTHDLCPNCIDTIKRTARVT